MSLAFGLLLVCIVFASGATIHEGFAVGSFISCLAAIALAFVGVSARAADVKFAGQATRYLKLTAAVPAIWMVIQLLPIPFGAHSIWTYAADALGRRPWGHVSIDLGATIVALSSYLANISLILVTLFVAKDRKKAELVLFVLSTITTATTLVLLVGKWASIAALRATDGVLGAISALGILLSLTIAIRAVERHESRQAAQARSIRLSRLGSGIGLLCCGVGLATSATLDVGLIAALAVVALGSIQVVRRSGLTGWTTGILVATVVLATAMTILWRYDFTDTVSPFLQFATSSSPDAISLTQRMLSDAGWLGTGAGTFSALIPIYQELGSSVTEAPSTASAWAIEFGLPMALFTIAAGVWLIVILYRGSLARGRDSFYPALAAASCIVILGQAFCDTSLLNPYVAVIADAVVGLGLAQSISGRQSL